MVHFNIWIVAIYLVSFIVLVQFSPEFMTLKAKHRRNKTNSRIIGGHYAREGQAPSMVSMFNKNNLTWGGHVCEGALIDQKTVITAAHCVIG